MNDISPKDFTVTYLTLPEIGDSPDENQEETLSKWSDKFTSLSRNPVTSFSYTSASSFYSPPMSRFSKPEPIELSSLSESGTSANQTVPFYATTPFIIRNSNDIYPLHPFYTSNTSSHSSKACLDCYSSHFYSDDDLLTLELPKSFSSLNTNTIFQREANFICSLKQSLTSSFSLNPHQSNAPNLTQVASISGIFTDYIVDEYKLGYVQLLSFSTDEAPF